MKLETFVADQNDDSLIREVNEDLREEQMMKLWQRYGSTVVGVAVLIVVIVAGNQIWKNYDISTRTADSDQYFAAQQLAASGSNAEALKAMQALSSSASGGYSVLAKFQEAALMVETGDSYGAAKLYQQIARDTIGDVALSGLANIMAAMVEVSAGSYDRAAMEFRLSTLAEPSHPYRHSARELLAIIAMEHSDTEKAKTTLNTLIEDKSAPQNLRMRAEKLLQRLGS
ncbi:MAG: tetratricopeptide repeat protein [Magnetovibrio sp.]|nr:tetratricopeptide repeat protein [Magnetovibrio sp.]